MDSRPIETNDNNVMKQVETKAGPDDICKGCNQKFGIYTNCCPLCGHEVESKEIGNNGTKYDLTNK